MFFTIAKRFTYHSGHHLTGLTPGHKCMRPHGHTYTVEVILEADVLQTEGWVRDYGDLSVIADWLKTWMDHEDLNDEVPQPTAELLAMHVYERWADDIPELAAVRVSESPETWAEYRPT